jgi:hypothetical protein
MIWLLIRINVMKLKYPLKYYCNHESAIDIICRYTHIKKSHSTKSTFSVESEMKWKSRKCRYLSTHSPLPVQSNVELWMPLFIRNLWLHDFTCRYTFISPFHVLHLPFLLFFSCSCAFSLLEFLAVDKGLVVDSLSVGRCMW